MWLHIFPRNKTLFEKRGAKHVLGVILRATCARGLYVWHKCERQLQSALTFLTYKAKLSQACDLSTESTTTFNKFPLAASQVLQAQRRDKSGNRTQYLTGDDKQFGCTVWVSGIGYLQKQGERTGRVISERRWLLQPRCHCQKHLAILLQWKEKTAVERKSCQVWSCTRVCIIPKGQRPFPDWCEVSWTSFPSGLATAFPFLVLISQNSQQIQTCRSSSSPCSLRTACQTCREQR